MKLYKRQKSWYRQREREKKKEREWEKERGRKRERERKRIKNTDRWVHKINCFPPTHFHSCTHRLCFFFFFHVWGGFFFFYSDVIVCKWRFFVAASTVTTTAAQRRRKLNEIQPCQWRQFFTECEKETRSLQKHVLRCEQQ